MSGSGLDTALRGLWWLLLARGVLTVVFGLIALFLPTAALLTLVVVFAIYAILDGAMAIALGVRHRSAESHWGWQVFQGVVSLLAGVAALVWPGVTALAALFLIAFWSIVLGVATIGEAVAMRRSGAPSWGWALAGGVVSVLFGIALLAWPGAGLLALLWLVGTFAVVLGVTIVVWAFRLRGAASTFRAGPAPAAPA